MPRKKNEEKIQDTAAVNFWDMPADSEQPKEEFDLDDIYNEAVDADKIITGSAELKEALDAKLGITKKPVEIKKLPKAEEPVATTIDSGQLKSLFGRKKEEPVEQITPEFMKEQPEGKPVLDEVKPFNVQDFIKKPDNSEVVVEAKYVEVDANNNVVNVVMHPDAYDTYKEESKTINYSDTTDKSFDGIDIPKSIIQEKAELAALNKSQMTPEQKNRFAELKAAEIAENTRVLENSIFNFNQSIANAPTIDISYYKNQLNKIRDSRPTFPKEGMSPDQLLSILSGIGMNIERLSTLLGNLTHVYNLYEGMIDTIEDMWSTVSLQTSEQTRRGEGALQINDVKIAHNDIRGLKVAYNIELDTLKTLKDTCAEIIKLIQIQVRLNEPVIGSSSFDGIIN